MSNDFPSVEPHGALQPIFADAWFVTGSVVFKPMIRLARNMVVLRHAGQLTVVNAVRLDEAGEAALGALGEVAHVVRIGFHAMDDAYYIDRFGATYWSVREQGDGPAPDHALTSETELPLPGVTVFQFDKTVNPEAALLVERDGGLLITCDSVQHWAPSELMSFGAKVVSRLMGFMYPAQIGRPWRGAQTPPDATLKPDFERLVALPFIRLIGGHGGLLDGDAPDALRVSIAREL